jgi:uncharacterized protein YbjQ (UPF0145 family)
MSFTSNLTVAEHHAIRSVGFTPVGQVLGSCVYSIGYTGTWNCGYWGAGYGRTLGPVASPGWQPGGLGGRNPGGVLGGVLGGGFGAGYGGMASQTVEAAGIRDSLYEARGAAMARMRDEAARAGGDGVVAVRLTVAPFEGAGLEFRAIGTAVRADGPVRPRQPFTSDLSGQEFGNLVGAGWVPTALVLGIAVMVRHDDWRTQYQNSAWTNQEVGGYTDLVTHARSAARERLRQDCARQGGETVVVRDLTLSIGERSCNAANSEGRDHIAEAMVVGTALVPFRHAGGNAPTPPLPVLRLTSGRTS